MRDEHYTLRQLNLLVREAIEDALPDEYWVEAELSECRENSGHCYMELIEKDERSSTPVALNLISICAAANFSLFTFTLTSHTGQYQGRSLPVA